MLPSGEECPNFAISELEGGGGERDGCSRRLDGAARYVTSHVNSTAAGSEVRWFSVGEGSTAAVWESVCC